MDRLDIRIDGRLVGHFIRRDAGRIGLIYDAAWVGDWRKGRAHALSAYLPVSEQEQDASAFAAGLLPDSTRHRTLLADELGIAEDPSDFAFLSKLGRDCAGALVVAPEGFGHAGPPALKPITEAELADHLRALPRRPLMIDENEGLTLSLAGVNDKAAIVLRKGEAALPLNGYPSTHIIKVDIPGLKDSVKTEHFCLRLADATGIRVPRTQLHSAKDQDFLLVARYDRRRDQNGNVTRIHQEDFCQALGYPPGRKYERHGGPGWADCFALVRSMVPDADAIEDLARMAVIQFLIDNPDAHAKNYSLLHQGPSGRLRLAPLYDLNNAAAFRHYFKTARPIMAMHIGDRDNPQHVRWEDWDVFAERCRLDEGMVRGLVTGTAAKLLEALPATLAEMPECEAIRVAAEDIRERCELWAPGPPPPTGAPVPEM
ncbi:type II toxin-antitoxin system HipA family toxin [Paracoccus sp. ME4]|uniref:type II toxin-antitoxin system HipA family toxin n=1 Tax=Paracoccus sp. ME4 TaxID=3138066 RepID=UPI00398B36E9